VNLEALAAGDTLVDVENHAFSVIVSQDCDLDQDHRARAEGRGAPLPHILFLPAVPVEPFKALLPLGSATWKRVKQNNDPRYHVIQSVIPELDLGGEGLPALGVDFKRCFSVATAEVWFRLREGGARRRCRLSTPWAEHLSSRLAYYLSRVALPQDHEVEE
jgi:hypothetical protein